MRLFANNKGRLAGRRKSDEEDQVTFEGPP